MLIRTTQSYSPGQLRWLVLAMLVLFSSFGSSFLTPLSTEAHSVSPTQPHYNKVSEPTTKVSPTNAGQLQFSSSAYTATEGAAGTTVVVDRVGGSAGAISATVVLSDVTTDSSDYQFSPGGSLDLSFVYTDTNPSDIVRAVSVQPADGKILIGGDLDSYNGMRHKYLARLNSDGTVDNTFLTANVGPNNTVRAIAVQPDDGKIVIAGSFTSYDGVSRRFLARLNSDGTLDNTFPTADTGEVLGIAVQPSDGKIIIVGILNSYNGTPVFKIARLYPDGSLDTTFNSGGTGSNYDLYGVAVQLDGKILIGGLLTSYNGVSRYRLARLNSDGSLDTSFDTAGFDSNTIVYALAVQPNGKIIVGGYFHYFVNSKYYDNLVRLNKDGTFDSSFDPGPFSNMSFFSDVSGIAIQVNTKILIAGDFTQYKNVDVNTLVRLNALGSVTLNWSDGDSSPRSFVITATNDGINEPTETAVLGLTNIQGGASAGSPVTATFAIVNCQPLIVTSNTDDGTGTSCGTLSYALSQPISGTSPATITFALTQNDTITFTGSLTTTAKVKPYLMLDGGANGVVINGNGVSGDGLHLAGHNFLQNLTIRGFVGRQLVTDGPDNRLQGVRASRT